MISASISTCWIGILNSSSEEEQTEKMFSTTTALYLVEAIASIALLIIATSALQAGFTAHLLTGIAASNTFYSLLNLTLRAMISYKANQPRSESEENQRPHDD